MFEPGSDFQAQSNLHIIKEIARGGMGTIFLARQVGFEGFEKIVALKTINPEHTENQTNLKLFIDEAKLVADLIHQSIVQVYNLGKFQSFYYIVMEYMHGRDLKQFMRRHRQLGLRIPIEVCAFVLSRVCRGLHYAHAKRDPLGNPLGIVHRDITPTNIIVDVHGFVKITDFGIAKGLTMGIPDETKVVMGKIPYMSPEQAFAKGTDFRSDIYSAGLVLYELLTGTRVYNVKTRPELLERMSNYRIKPPMEIFSRIPEQLNDIVMKALETDPTKRFGSAMEFCVALERFMYSDKYGPTNEKLGKYFHKIFPEMNKNKIF